MRLEYGGSYKYKTTAKLKDSAYIVELGKWRDVILDVLKSTDINLSVSEKRKILLERIRQETGNDSIEYLIYHVKEGEWADINSLYYQQNGEMKNWEKINFIMGNLFKYNIEDDNKLVIDEANLDFITNNFETYKSMVSLRIKLLKLVISGEIQVMSYSEIEKYFSSREKKMLRFLHMEDIIDRLSAYRESNQMNSDLLDEYEDFLNQMQSADELKKFIDKYQGLKGDSEESWFFDYFSGCVARSSVTCYDVNSLCIFDTRCVDIMANEPIQEVDETDINDEEVDDYTEEHEEWEFF